MITVPEFLEDGGSKVRLQYLATHAVRITHADPESGEFKKDRPWLTDVLIGQNIGSDPFDERKTENIEDGDPVPRLSVMMMDGCAQVAFAGKSVLQETGKPVKNRKGEVTFELGIHLEESFYGWGEWFNAFQRKNGKIVLQARESLSMMQGRQTYSTIPFFLSSRGYGFFLLNSFVSRWHLQPEKGVMTVQTAGPPLDYIVIYGPSFKQILTTYTSLTGRPPILPKWAFGLWVTSYPQGDQVGVLAHVEEHRKRKIPLDAVILDYHWEERFHNFRWRESLFPDPDGMIARLRESGMRLGLIFTPFLNQRNQPIKKIGLQLLAKDIPKGMLFDDERALTAYQEALEKGYLAHPDAEWWFGKGGMIDFSNQEAADWWQKMMKPLYDQGIDFFKNDDGEYLPKDASSVLGMSGREYHNLYGFYYGKAIYEGMQAFDDRRGLIYARSVWAGSQRYPGVFLGDQKPTFKCMQRTMRAGLNLGLAGFAYWTADVFGLDGRTTEEMHMRYAQWALLNPIARYFWRPPRVDDTRFPWSHSQRAEENFRFYTDLRYRLLPYYYMLAWQAWQTGLPVVRPLLLEFQGDERFVDVYDQYLLGESLLVAPVVEKGVRMRRIMLPEGVWHDYWSEQSYEGPGEIEYPAPLERLPVLVKGGSVLPMGPRIQQIPDGHQFDDVTLHCYPPFPAEGLLYEDDGSTTAYQRGEFWLTTVRVITQKGKLVIQIITDHNAPQVLQYERKVKLVLHHVKEPAGMMAEHGKLTGWHYDADLSRLEVCLSHHAGEDTTLYLNHPLNG